ncbi:hypothetical protein E2C01_049121 [Portunus trituberculatus]|uniref:Uncharacterized protein n=1 Tax=Portunus trituberculatus TaxID=210409 RepID=A0A5B7G4T5_PORTR|nr:hypothetical protein [Portunus trituberculatus]
MTHLNLKRREARVPSLAATHEIHSHTQLCEDVQPGRGGPTSPPPAVVEKSPAWNEHNNLKHCPCWCCLEY